LNKVHINATDEDGGQTYIIYDIDEWIWAFGHTSSNRTWFNSTDVLGIFFGSDLTDSSYYVLEITFEYPVKWFGARFVYDCDDGSNPASITAFDEDNNVLDCADLQQFYKFNCTVTDHADNHYHYFGIENSVGIKRIAMSGGYITFGDLWYDEDSCEYFNDCEFPYTCQDLYASHSCVFECSICPTQSTCDSGAETCICDDDHYSIQCLPCQCGAFGHCFDGIDGNGTCVCDDGWSGVTCSIIDITTSEETEGTSIETSGNNTLTEDESTKTLSEDESTNESTEKSSDDENNSMYLSAAISLILLVAA